MFFKTDLPIADLVPQLISVLMDGQTAVVQAPPGAGKTTIIPLSLLGQSWLGGRKIVMLEPRRLAARAAAYRMSELLGEDVGGSVGYRTRLDSKVGPATRIEVVTEGILTRMLQSDPSIETIGCLIFDEFHERSLNADLGLAFSLDARSLFREDLRIVVMSATLDEVEVSRLLDGAPILKSEGRSYPVEVRYRPLGSVDTRWQGLTGPQFISGVVKAVSKALVEESGSILVFLPGSGEIHRVEAGIRSAGLGPDIDIVPLYGEIPRAAQDMAIRPSLAGRRKVVLATNIAETSITIDGVSVVIDGGLQRLQRFSPSIGMSRLETVRVTRSGADQRTGRAGRTGPGISIRLWSEYEDSVLMEKNRPEIMEADLTALALELALWGVKEPERLRWLDLPPAGSLAHARETLVRMGAIDKLGLVTAHGKRLATLPLHPRLAQMVLKADGLGQGALASVIAALLTERDPLGKTTGERDSDIRHRIEAVTGHAKGRAVHTARFDIDKALCERISASAGQIRKRLGIRESLFDIDMTGIILAFAYPDRIGRRRDGTGARYLLSNGRGAYFSSVEQLSSAECIVAANIDAGERESRIFLGAPLERADLEEYLKDDITYTSTVIWDTAVSAVLSRRQKRLWGLVLSDAPIADPDKEQVLEAFLYGVRQALRQNGLVILPWDKHSENLRARINLLHRFGVSEGVEFPDLSDERLVDNINTDGWLGPWCVGMTRLEHLKRLDMKGVILSLLSWQAREALDRLAPTHFKVPSGSSVAIDYTAGERPVLAVRLQEMFGCALTPSIAGGRVELVLHLLSPAGRTVQVTSDLAGFWASSYQMVKKEMKGRYPKHHWPDDPLEAVPARGAKRRKKDD